MFHEEVMRVLAIAQRNALIRLLQLEEQRIALTPAAPALTTDPEGAPVCR
jgi:hypothetical protein